MKLRTYNRGREGTLGYIHWCPGCNEPHAISVAEKNSMGAVWSFNGNLERPTFSPSVRITGKQTVRDAEGNWTGEWARGADGKPLNFCCHYFIIDGNIQFCGDSTHALAGQTIPLPDHWKEGE